MRISAATSSRGGVAMPAPFLLAKDDTACPGFIALLPPSSGVMIEAVGRIRVLLVIGRYDEST
jgi:hypothetical protein